MPRIRREVPVDEITIGKRFRQDMGDLAGLAKSIEAVGLLHDVIVDKDYRLIAGQRRLVACKELGWTEIPAKVVSLDNPLAAERDENEHHKPFTVTEKVAMAQAIEEQEKVKAKERQKEGQTLGGQTAGRGREKVVEKFSETNGESDRAATRAAEAVGMSRPTYEKAKAVVQAAEAEPEKFAEVAEEMDKSGKVDPAYKQVQPFADRSKSRFRTKKQRRERDPATMLKRLKELWKKTGKQERSEFLSWASGRVSHD